MFLWKKGDLLEVTLNHCIDKGTMDSDWPYVFAVEQPAHSIEIEKGTFVIAMDLCPTSSSPARVTRIIHQDGIWVSTCKYLKPVKNEST